MQIVAYADESIRGKPPRATTSYDGNLVMCGFIAPKDYWNDFSKEWSLVLKKFGVTYFHFRELNASQRKKSGNPYHGWSNERVDDFIYDLAVLAGRVAVPFGSNNALVTPRHRHDTWKETAETFFHHFLQMMDLHWPGFKDPVHFFFDRQENQKIIGQLNDAITEYQNKDSRIGDYTFSDKKGNPPLQAADMAAYALGQIGERAINMRSAQNNRIIDLLLFKNQYPAGHQLSLPPFVNEAAYDSLIADFRQHKKIWDAKRKAAGLPKTEYFPGIHFETL